MWYRPLVQFGVDDVLCLVGRCPGRERDEVSHKLTRHPSQQFVHRGQGLPCSSGSHTQHLGRERGGGASERKHLGDYTLVNTDIARDVSFSYELQCYAYPQLFG